MTDDLDRIQTALSLCYLESDPIFERTEQLFDFKLSFNFVSGDNVGVWPNRTAAIKAVCGNCGFNWIAGFMPMPRSQLNRVMERAGFCVRCCESEKVVFREMATIKTVSNSESISSKNSQKMATKNPIFHHTKK